MKPHPSSPRTRLTVAGRALAVTATAVLAVGALGSSAAHAAPADRASTTPQVRVTQVYAASTAVETGTTVRTSTVVRSASRTTQPSRTLRLYLTDGTRSYGLTTVATPTLPRGSERVLRTSGPAPLSVPAGRYAVRSCLGPLGAQVCRTSSASVLVGRARLTADPSSLSFAATASDASTRMTVTITNTGHARTQPLVTTISGPDAADYSVAEQYCAVRLVPGASCVVDLAFAPTGNPGTRSATLRLSDGTVDIEVPVTGEVTGTSDFQVDPSSFDFGDVAVGTSVTRAFRIVNNTDAESQTAGDDGEDPSFGFDFGVPAEDFTCASGPLAARSSCTFSVRFAPQTVGLQSTTVTLFAGEQALTLELTGSGTPGAKPAPRLPRESHGGFGS